MQELTTVNALPGTISLTDIYSDYAAFLDGLTRRVAEALERYAAEHCPGCGAEPMFFFAAAQSFVGVLRMTMEDCAEREKTLRYLRQVFRFQFAYFEARLNMIGDDRT